MTCKQDCTIEDPVESCECNIFNENPSNIDHTMTSEDQVLIDACVTAYENQNPNTRTTNFSVN